MKHRKVGLTSFMNINAYLQHSVLSTAMHLYTAAAPLWVSMHQSVSVDSVSLTSSKPCSDWQERLALSVVTHRISTLHLYNTRQQTGLTGQQLNMCKIMPGKFTPTENNCDCAQAVINT